MAYALCNFSNRTVIIACNDSFVMVKCYFMGVKKMRMLSAVGSLFGLALCAALPAKATTLDYTFNFTGSAFSGSGNIFVNSQIDSLGGYDITGITGSINGPSNGAITQLDTQPGTPNATGLYTDTVTGNQWIYNDVLFTNGVPFDYYGVLFSFGSNYIANIYSIGSQLYFSVSQPNAYFNPGDAIIQMQLSETPLPAAFPMFLTGIGGLWFVWRRRNKKASDTRSQLNQFASAA